MPSINVIELSRALLRFNTVNPPGDEHACARHLGRILESNGFDVREYQYAASRTSLVARIGGSSERAPICFAGHIDTVPLGAVPWSHDPFASEIVDGKLYGRGSTDMKCGVAAFVAAACRMARHVDTRTGIVLVIVAGEETGCDGSRHLAKVGGALGTAGALVIAEPTSNYPFVGHKGALWLDGHAVGVTAHGSMPERGVNAIYKASRAALQLERFDFEVEPHPVLGMPSINVGTIVGGLNINSVPDRASIGIDIRTIPGQQHAKLIERLTRVLGHDVNLNTRVDVGGIWTDPADPWLQEVFELATPIVGGRPEARGAPYFTDASALTPAYGNPPTVILGPGELELAHKTDEYCQVDRLEQAVELYEQIARRWCRV